MPEASEKLAGGRASPRANTPGIAGQSFGTLKGCKQRSLARHTLYVLARFFDPSRVGTFISSDRGLVARSSLDPRLISLMPPASRNSPASFTKYDDAQYTFIRA